MCNRDWVSNGILSECTLDKRSMHACANNNKIAYRTGIKINERHPSQPRTHKTTNERINKTKCHKNSHFFCFALYILILSLLLKVCYAKGAFSLVVFENGVKCVLNFNVYPNGKCMFTLFSDGTHTHNQLIKWPPFSFILFIFLM